MAPKLLTLEEAALRLNISPADLNSLRERHKLYAYRDGASWKFKEDEIERYLRDQEDEAPASADSGDLLDLPLELDAPSGEIAVTSMDEGEDLVLASELELGESDPNTSSTIIGRAGAQQRPEESDIRISVAEELGSDVKLVPDVDDAGNSGVRVVPAAGNKAGRSDSKLQLGEESGLSLPAAPTAKTKPPKANKPTAKDEEADVSYALLDDKKSAAGRGGSDVRLADSSADHVLQGPDSDVTKVSVADSGISLADPADSGLSLEESLDLGGGGPELELGGDNDSDFELLHDSSSETDAVKSLQSDDEFLLTPMGDLGSDDSEGSGSQVIALDSAEDFGDSAAMLGESPAGVVAAVDDVDLSSDFSSSTMGMTPGGAAVVMPMRVGDVVNFSLLNVITLGFCALFVLLGGMMAFDLMRNMWGWNQAYSVNSGLMDFICGLVGI
ncbi:MAG: helix-turn-helix domain-containing protein [Pirellulales bacterium]|nr:helix-turn-helix domain-containing protein [Pirellulales bacterium]